MMFSHETNIARLLAGQIGEPRARAVLAVLEIDPSLLQPSETVSRAELAMTLNAMLFDGLLSRVPSAAAYVERIEAGGGHILFDHGALRTIRFASGGTGALPGGTDAITRLLEPLGYRHAAVYPLPGLSMTGHAWRHADLPASIPQFFVSELHVDRFSPDFQAAAARVFGTSRDPLTPESLGALGVLAEQGQVEFPLAAQMLPVLASAFERQHEICSLTDYRTLLSESPEAAWIATEGNAFNHATDRVSDVEALAAQLRAEGQAMKDKVEHSASGRVRQTAFRADQVERRFRDGDDVVTRMVPGSFYEFISRDIDPTTGELDLAFDSSNAQGIFTMTQAA